MRAWMRTLFAAMQDEVTANVVQGAKEAKGSDVSHLLDTFSAELRCDMFPTYHSRVGIVHD